MPRKASATDYDVSWVSLGTLSAQDATNIAVTGGTLNGTAIGGTSAAPATFTTLVATSQTSLGGVAGGESLRAMAVTSSVNWLQVSGGSTGTAVGLSAQGADTNVDLNITPKGSGSVRMTVPSSVIGSGLFVQNNGGTGYIRFGTGSSSGGFFPLILGVSTLSTNAAGLSLQAQAGSDTDTSGAVLSLNARNNAGTGTPGATQTAFGITNFTNRVFSVMGGTTPIAVLGPPTSTSPFPGTLRTADASGTDLNARELVLAGGRSTGTGSGGALVFQTTPASAVSGSTLNTSTERLRITATGDIYGTAGSSSMAAGFIFIPAGNTPTGTPATYAGRLPLYYDSVNNKLYVYNGGWKASAAFA